MEEKLWKRIGTESDAFWVVDVRGMELAFGGFNAILRDYARFGMLYLQEGKSGGEAAISSDCVSSSVTPDAPHLQPGDNPHSNSVLGYGYQWWIPLRPEGDFLAIGIAGQYIYINKTHGIVIAKSSAYMDYKKDSREKMLKSIEMFRAIAKSI